MHWSCRACDGRGGRGWLPRWRWLVYFVVFDCGWPRQLFWRRCGACGGDGHARPPKHRPPPPGGSRPTSPPPPPKGAWA